MLSATYPLAKSVLFKLDPEKAHHLSLDSLRSLENLGVLKCLAGEFPHSPVECMGLKFPNPVGLAAGMDKEGNSIDAFGRLGFGFVEIGTITPISQAGNPKPRMFRLPEHEGLINRMGFNNPGIETGVTNVMKSKTFRGIKGFNIGKNKVTPNEEAVNDYLICLRAAYPVADYITVNLSSPNTPGLRDLQNESETAKLLNLLKMEQAKLAQEYGKEVPITLKVAPDLDPEHIKGLAKVFKEEGLDGLVATNTTIDRHAVQGHQFAEEAGGLSGAPVTTKSTDVIAAFYAELGESIPIIGVGGIMNGEEAADKIKAGAKLVQLYSGFVYKGPQLIADSISAIKAIS